MGALTSIPPGVRQCGRRLGVLGDAELEARVPQPYAPGFRGSEGRLGTFADQLGL